MEETTQCSFLPMGFIPTTPDSDSDAEPHRDNESEAIKSVLFASSMGDETDNGTCNTLPQQNTDNHISAVKHQSTVDSPAIQMSTNTVDMYHPTPQVKIVDGKYVPATPTKPTEATNVGPVTPTTNLKILLSAASPIIRERDNRKKKLFPHDPIMYTAECPPSNAIKLKEEQSDSEEVYDDTCKPVSRKEKSLGLLCQRFLSRFPDYPNPALNNEISLDVVAHELSVERRRIYDIVNVLESVEIVSRFAKNKYIWHGKVKLLDTLTKLRNLGETENYASQIQHLKKMQEEREFNFGEDLKSKKEPLHPTESENMPLRFCNSKDGLEKFNNRKDKSLGVMSQKFIMLFLVSKTKVVSLDIAARILIGDINYEINENSKFKTKIRRLYDIANILTSLNLIKKVHVTEARGRKPAFKWVGPEPGTGMSNEEAATSENLNVLKEPNVMKENNNPKVRRPASNLHRQRLFQRHASFQSICEVVEQERSKLCSSAPSSPSKADPEQAAKLQAEFESLKKLNTPTMSRLLAICNMEQEKQQQQRETKQILPKPDSTVAQQPLQQIMLQSVMVPGSGISGIINSNVGKLQTVTVPVTQFNSVSGSFTFPTQTIITVDGLNKPVSQVPLVTRRSKRTKKHHASEEFEYQPVVKRSKVDAQPIGMAVNQGKESSVMFTAADSSQLHTGRDETDGVQLLQETHVNVQKVCDIPQENRPETDELVKMPTAILSRRRSSVALGNKPSPLRVLHNDPEFRSSPTDSVNSSKNASPVDSKFDAKDLELAVPLQEDHTEDTKHDDAPKTVQAQNDQTVTTCLPKPELPGSLASEQVKETPSVSSAESSQTSLLFSQSPLHLLLNNRSSSNSPARFMSRPSSLSSMAELERAFGSGESPFPIVSPNPVFGKRSKSASPSHFQSLINSQAQAMLAGMSQQTAPTKVNSVSPVLLPHGGMNTSTSPSDFSFNNSMFSFSFNQLLQGASNQHTPVSSAPAQPAQAMNSIPTTALPLVPTTMQSMPNTILQMPHMTQLSLLQAPQTNGNIVHLPTTTTFVQTPMSSRVQTSMAHLSVPMYQTSHPNQINQVAPVPFSFTQAQVAQWSTPITGSAHNRAALMAGMSPIMPSETYSPKSLTPGDKSYQNMLFTPRTQMSPATTLNTTPLINTELNNSSFFHTPNMYSMANTGNLLQHNAPQVIGPSAFQHVPANLPANGKFTTSRRLALPQFSESFKQPPQA